MHGDDRLSELPESLITQILSYLPTKDSVKTSVLSSRWKNLWLNVPVLDLDFYDFPPKREDQVFLSFLDRFLEFNPMLFLQKVKVKCWIQRVDGLKDRIGTAIGHGVQHLVVKGMFFHTSEGCAYPSIDFIPLNLYTCKALVSLKLIYSGLPDPGVFSMPCLKFMHLDKIMWLGTMNMEKLISGCHVLEELTLLTDLFDNKLGVTHVKSRSLKRFCVPTETRKIYRPRKVFKTLEFDAPALEYMSIKDDISERWVVKNLSSLLEIDLDIKFLVSRNELLFFDPEDESKRNEIRDFFTRLSSVRHMIISQKTVKALDLYSKRGVIPKFNNLSRLQAAFPCDLLQFLPAFLESCPNLKHLILEVLYSKEIKMFSVIDVPRCLLSTLEYVMIKGFAKWEKEEMKIASYFLENSAVLKKLIVSFADYPHPDPDPAIYEELNKLPKCSQGCQISIAF